MRLRATRPMTIRVPALDLAVSFPEGEKMRTQISGKFRPTGIGSELAAASVALAHWWTDAASDFGLPLARRVGDR